MYLLSGRKRTVTKLTKKDKSETKNRMFRYENPNRSHSHILFLIFFITIIHKTASLPIRNFLLRSLFSVDFQNKKKQSIKTHTHKSYLGKSIVGYFCREAILKKNDTVKEIKVVRFP